MVDDFSEIIVWAVSAERPRKESLALRLAGGWLGLLLR